MICEGFGDLPLMYLFVIWEAPGAEPRWPGWPGVEAGEWKSGPPTGGMRATRAWPRGGGSCCVRVLWVLCVPGAARCFPLSKVRLACSSLPQS